MDLYSFRNMVIGGGLLKDLQDYIKEGYPVGHFLEAIICNDLKEACSRADDHNLYLIPAYVGYLYNKAPMQCWGSKLAYKNWINDKRAERLALEEDEADEAEDDNEDEAVKHIGDL